MENTTNINATKSARQLFNELSRMFRKYEYQLYWLKQPSNQTRGTYADVLSNTRQLRTNMQEKLSELQNHLRTMGHGTTTED